MYLGVHITTNNLNYCTTKKMYTNTGGIIYKVYANALYIS